MKIKATCQVLDTKTDAVISERVIGEFDTVEAATSAAKRELKEGEVIAVYNAPEAQEHEIGASEWAEWEAAWDEYAK
jgi:hypothetical protein